MSGFIRSIVLVYFFSQGFLLNAEGIVHHELTVRVEPDKHYIHVLDEITLPEIPVNQLTFELHKNFKITPLNKRTIVRKINDSNDGITQTYFLIHPIGSKKVAILYEGKINHPIESVGKERSRGFNTTLGIISEHGVYLSGSSYWVPHFENTMLTFSLKTNLPLKWSSVSQGREKESTKLDKSINHWEETNPEQEIYLIAAPFITYEKQFGQTQTLVYLRKRDDNLASKYLESTVLYLEMYEKLLG